MTQFSLRQLHVDIWRKLWTTGFGISHSMADNAINGQQINATMYYVLSQVSVRLVMWSLNSTCLLVGDGSVAQRARD